MKKSSLLFWFLAASCSTIVGQGIEKANLPQRISNTIYLEGGGICFAGSINYELGFLLNKGERNRNKVNLRVGTGTTNFGEWDDMFNLGISLDLGRKNWFFQTNLNRNFSFSPPHDFLGTSVGIAVVRRPEQGIYFHVGGGLIFYDREESLLGGSTNTFIWPALGVGYSF